MKRIGFFQVSALICLMSVSSPAAPVDSHRGMGSANQLARPTELEIVSIRAGTVRLGWLDNSSGESGFRIYRGDSVDQSTAADAREADVAPPRGERVTYSVKAYNEKGESLRSNRVELQLPVKQEREDTLSAVRVGTDDSTVNARVSYGYHSQNGPRVLLRMTLLDTQGHPIPGFIGTPVLIDRSKGAEGQAELSLRHFGWFSATSSSLRLEMLTLSDDDAKDPSDEEARPELQMFFSETVDPPPVQKAWSPANTLKTVSLKQVGLTNAAEIEVSYCWNGKAGQAAHIEAELLDAMGDVLPTRGLSLPATACPEGGGLQTGSFRIAFAGDQAQRSTEMRIQMMSRRGDVLAERRVPCAYTWPPDSIAITGFERTGVNRIRLSGEYNFNSHARAELLFLPVDPATEAPPADNGILGIVPAEGTKTGPTTTSNLLDRGHGKFDWELSYSGWKTFTSSQLRVALADTDPAAWDRLYAEGLTDPSIVDLVFFQIERPMQNRWRSTLLAKVTCLGCGRCCRSWVYQDGSVIPFGEHCINVQPIASLRTPGSALYINGFSGFNLQLPSRDACMSFMDDLNAQKKERSGMTTQVALGDLVLLSLSDAIPSSRPAADGGWVESWISTDRFQLDYFTSPVLTVQAVYADRLLPRARVNLRGTKETGEAAVRTRTTDAVGEVVFYEYETRGWKKDVTVDVQGPAGGEQMDTQQKALLSELSFTNVDATPVHLGDEEKSFVADLTPPYYVGELRNVTFYADEDPSGTDEVFFVAAAKPGKGEKDHPQGLMWPVQTDSKYSWYESNGGQPLAVNSPWFAFLPAQVHDKVYLGIAGMDNDVMPAIVDNLVSMFTWLGSAVATAFGQVELAAAIQSAGELIDGMLEKAEAAKMEKLGKWTGELTQSDLDRKAAANEVTSQVNGNIRVEYSLSRQKTPPLTRKVRVVLQDILIKENGDWSDGEIRVFTRVCDRPLPRPDPTRPGEMISPCAMQSISLGSVADGRLMEVNKTLFESDRLGPYLFIEVGTWDKDEPDWGDDNDLLGECSATFTASENYGIGSTVFLTDGTNSGGPVTVRLLITDQ